MTTVVYYNHHETNLNSTALSDIYYDSISCDLYVEFHSGTIAGYANVAQFSYDLFINASSIGKWYSANLKNNYAGINGDVELKERPWQDSDVFTNRKFSVYVSVDGTLRFEIDAAGYDDAVEEVHKLLDKARVVGAYKVTSVRRNP